MRDANHRSDPPFPDDEAAPDEVVRAVSGALRRPVPSDPALTARVMATVAAMPRPRRRGARSWLTTPRMIAISPLGGLIAAGVVGLLAYTALARWRVIPAGQPRATTPVATTAAPPGESTVIAVTRQVPPAAAMARETQFVLVAPRARSVALVGDFNEWNAAATPLHRSAGGLWTATVPLLPGAHRYAYLVDGARWEPDPRAPRAPDADFGAATSVVVVGGVTP